MTGATASRRWVLTIIAGLGGGTRNSAGALAETGRLGAVGSQRRVLQVRGAGVNATGVPDEMLGFRTNDPPWSRL